MVQTERRDASIDAERPQLAHELHDDERTACKPQLGQHICHPQRVPRRDGRRRGPPGRETRTPNLDDTSSGDDVSGGVEHRLLAQQASRETYEPRPEAEPQ